MFTEPVKGIAAIIGAAAIWGLSPLYYKMLVHVPALDVLSHRMLWSFVLFAGVLAVQGRLREVFHAVGNLRAFAIMAIASVMIAANWTLFIWSVQVGRTTETSLGYYIFPLVAVVSGRVFFKEKLSGTQWTSVGIAAIAVMLLTLGLGKPPWIALTLALTFGMYGLIKKRLDIGPVVSVTAEVMLLIPVAGLILLQSYHNGSAVFGGDWRTMVLLMLAGPITAIPLILFSYGARRLALATVGLLQYINPTLQFACAVFVFSEPFGQWHMIAFSLIWAALALYSFSAVRQDKARRKAVTAPAASGTAQ